MNNEYLINMLIEQTIKKENMRLMATLSGHKESKQLTKLSIEQIRNNDQNRDLYQNFIRTLISLATFLNSRSKKSNGVESEQLNYAVKQVFGLAKILENYIYFSDDDIQKCIRSVVNSDIKESCNNGMFSYYNTREYLVNLKMAYVQLSEKYMEKGKSYQKR